MADDHLEDVVNEEQVLEQMTLRQYQIELSDTSKKQNSIIFLPTGCGKTFIALQVLRSKMKDLANPVGKGRKIAVFLGTTKLLVNQLAEVVQENTNLTVKVFLGEMGVDDWTLQTWKKETADAQVLVMVPVIFLIIIQRKIVRSDSVCIIVFDECHHAVLKHPYRQIMQEFDFLPDQNKPLILGLTATVLNSNPTKDGIEEVKMLKTTLNSSFARTDRLEEALRFGTSAEQNFLSYPASEESKLDLYVLNFIEQVFEDFESVKISGAAEKRSQGVMPENCILLAKKNSVVKEIRNIFKYMERAVKDMGIYPASIVALLYYIKLERLRLLKENPAAITAIKHAQTVLNLIRRTIFRYVPINDVNNVRKFSSKKIIKLIDFVAQYKEKPHLKCIIIVEERTTAAVLSELFNELCRNGDSFYKAEFVTGGIFKTVVDQEESKYEQRRLKKIVSSFRNDEFKFLFATDVIEEGIDIPSCSLVIKYDYPKDYRSYIQSKGRARFKDSKYIVMCNEMDVEDISCKMAKFNNIHENLLKILTTVEGVQSFMDEEDSIKEPEEEEIFYVKGSDGPHITGTKAVGFVIRYCCRLPQDKFSFLEPVCWYDPEKKRAYLRLPASSPIRKTIVGDVKSRRKLAKKNVFLKTVEELYKAGEILDDLSLRSYKCKEEEHEELFESCIKVLNDKSRRPESSGSRKKYPIEFAKNLCRCMPMPDSESYLHVIKVTPEFPRPQESRAGMFYDLLCDSSTYAILSRKRLSEICDFPLFLSMGDFKCSLEVNAATVFLTNSDLEKLRKFHFFVFNSLLRVVNVLHVMDRLGEQNSFLVVPVKYVDDKPVINWDPINDPVSCTQNAELSEMGTKKPGIEDFAESVVYPIYRQSSCTNKYYIVTSLDRSQTPMSTFPSEDFENYYEYFMSKYQLRIRDKEQPLCEVKAIPERINYLKPRKLMGVKSKRNYGADDDNYKEHLVPELCVRITFPALLWLKATLLPTALYRVMTISHIDEMRKDIASATKLGVCEKGSDFVWLPLEVEKETAGTEQSENLPFEWICNTKQRLMTSQDEDPDSQAPVDLFRHLNDCAPCDLIHYVKYFGLINDENESSDLPSRKEEGTKGEPIAEEDVIEVPDIPLFFDNPKERGPELRDFVKVFTCKSANDIVDLEKLEFLGDSFLKFSSAFYVFRKYNDNEGVLVSIKDTIVSNKNLYCCGIRKGFQGVLLTNDFDPKSGWNPPLFCLPPEIESLTDEDTDSFEIEYTFTIPVKDKLDGKLNPKTVKAIQDFANLEEKRSVYTPDEIVLRRKTIPDKSISDCVEALLGLYVKECGLEAGFKLLNWLKILPESDGTYDAVVQKKFSNDHKGDFNQITESLTEMCYKEIEKILGYQFKDKALLLEALTHPSVIDGLVPSYQRLEFLGDAVIDFLVTLFIHHSSPRLCPGEMTDIRMSLVNNVTMACLAVKYNFHKHLKYQSPPLMGAISQFVNFQKERNHKIDVAVKILSEEGEFKLSEAVEVPKALGDLFESLAGAVFLDSGNCLRTVWKSYYRLMKDTIDVFIRDPPKSPIRKLYEYCKNPPEFVYEDKDNGFTVATCTIYHRDKEYGFRGKAGNRRDSKLSAAKHAVAFLEGLIDESRAITQSTSCNLSSS